MSMTSESDERLISSGVDSPSLDDANSGGTTGGNGPLKKGPWTSAEDAILVEYVNKHGEGNWNAVQKHSGLARCGKSCRLRWANHLRPDLKKGAFTPEEERRIIELHAKMGNKWARMAAELPGRTDNEIKNYWNTRIKRRQRAGLPIYPPDICMQTMNETQQSDTSINALSSTDVCHPEFIPVNGLDIPAVQFKNLELYQHSHQALLNIPAAGMLDVPTSSLLNSFSNKPLYPPAKRLRESEPSFTGLNPVGIGDAFLSSGGCQYPNDQITQPFIIPPSYDHHNNLNSTDHAMTSSSLLPGSHAVLNGNASSEPTNWAMKPELPSLQNQVGSWGLSSPSSPLPFYESIDVLIETPPNEQNQVFNNLEAQNSGLLDAILYESVAKKNSNTNSMIANGIHETEWEAYDDQFSPLGHSSSSVCTPMSGNSFDEPHSNVTFPVKEEASNLGQIQYDDKGENANQMFFSRPDYLLASNCFVPMNHPTRDSSSLKDALGKFLVDDFNRDNKETDTDATSSGQGRVHDSCDWNAMSTV